MGPELAARKRHAVSMAGSRLRFRDVTGAAVRTTDLRAIAAGRSGIVLAPALVTVGCAARAAKVTEKKVRLFCASIAPVTFWRRSVPV
jgi:hypothetical protein